MIDGGRTRFKKLYLVIVTPVWDNIPLRCSATLLGKQISVRPKMHRKVLVIGSGLTRYGFRMHSPSAHHLGFICVIAELESRFWSPCSMPFVPVPIAAPYPPSSGSCPRAMVRIACK